MKIFVSVVLAAALLVGVLVGVPASAQGEPQVIPIFTTADATTGGLTSDGTQWRFDYVRNSVDLFLDYDVSGEAVEETALEWVLEVSPNNTDWFSHSVSSTLQTAWWTATTTVFPNVNIEGNYFRVRTSALSTTMAYTPTMMAVLKP